MERSPNGIFGLVALVAGLAGAALWISMLLGPIDLATGLLGARDHLQAAERALQEPAFDIARYEVAAAEADVGRARRGLETGGPLLQIARLARPVDDALGEVDLLLDAAGHSVAAARGTIEIAQGALEGPDRVIADDPDGEGSVIRLDRIRELGGRIIEVRSDLGSAAASLRDVDLAKLPARAAPGIRRGIRQATEARRLLADAEEGFALLPQILGSEGPRNYLIGMQNPAEQRGTGGAILQFATLHIEDGRPTLGEDEEAARTVYDVDRDRVQLDVPLPEDAWYVQGVPDARRFGNSNWSPDWPLSAQLSVAYGTAAAERFPGVDFPEPDGVIAADPHAVAKLMPAVGPYQTRSSNRVTANNVVQFVLYRAYATYPFKWHRRPVLRQVVDGFYKGLLSPRQPTKLLNGMGGALGEKNIQIWMKQPDEQRFIRKMGWDGAIKRARRSAYMFVVEQNVGGNKLDLFSHLTDTADITIDGDDAQAQTQIQVGSRILLPQPRWVLGDSGPIHRPMINLYAPGDATLTGWSFPPECPPTTVHDVVCRRNVPEPAVWTGGPPEHLERGKKVWSGTIEVPPNQDASVTFEYLMPDVVRTIEGRKVFRLVIQQQPKVRPKTTVVRLRLPSGARGVRAPGFEREGDILIWEKATRTDETVEVSWRE